MSRPESKNGLSQEGKARKEAMLGQLQDELVSVHHKRRQRTAVAKGAALVAAVAIAGLAWSFRVPASDSGNRIAEGSSNVVTSTSQRISVASNRFSVASVSNVSGIDQRCVVVNTDSSATIETMADDELLTMLAAAGQPSVLGKIKGKVCVIPDVAPARKQVKAL